SRSLPALRGQTAPAATPRVFPPPNTSLPAEETSLDWRRIASALLRFKWLVVLVMLAGLGAAIAATRMLHPVYRAQANVWIDVMREGGADARGPIRQRALLDADGW